MQYRMCDRVGCQETFRKKYDGHRFCSRECYIADRYGKGPKVYKTKKPFACEHCGNTFYHSHRNQSAPPVCTTCNGRPLKELFPNFKYDSAGQGIVDL